MPMLSISMLKWNMYGHSVVVDCLHLLVSVDINVTLTLLVFIRKLTNHKPEFDALSICGFLLSLYPVPHSNFSALHHSKGRQIMCSKRHLVSGD